MVKFKCLPTDRYHKRQEKYTGQRIFLVGKLSFKRIA